MDINFGFQLFVILTPGAVGTLPELQQAGFHYAK
jgi:hypothetical protein